ncbi:hypothetical protein E3T28_16100 [Cryobacterium sinapicolor]|uniref:Uncharacterized protein n=1 Tax=Cryobacterium sinapicolor TaxID=1259236 RepID=A0ABY2IT89_9MICO|nr:hypothetical protein [Cryobacterium sinapicolor]TFC93920.1 hypothetical protein E3T28_16100 [Cryobacterium sinapicolor]
MGNVGHASLLEPCLTPDSRTSRGHADHTADIVPVQGDLNMSCVLFQRIPDDLDWSADRIVLVSEAVK